MMEAAEIQVQVQHMQMLSGGRGDGSWRYEVIPVQMEDGRQGWIRGSSVQRRLRLGRGGSEPCRLRNGFVLFGKCWGEGV